MLLPVPPVTVRVARAAEASSQFSLAAREGDVEQAADYGSQAITGGRKSLPSLLMVSHELSDVLAKRYPHEPATADYLDQLRTLAAG